MDKILEGLIKSGKITHEDIREIERRIIDSHLIKAVDIIHSILCNKPHLQPGEIDADGCLYYVEEQMDSTWTRDEHIYWLDKTREIMYSYKIVSSEEFLEKLIKAMKLSEEFARLDRLTKRIFVDYIVALGVEY